MFNIVYNIVVIAVIQYRIIILRYNNNNDNYIIYYLSHNIIYPIIFRRIYIVGYSYTTV